MQTSFTNDLKMAVNQKLVRTAGLAVLGAIAIAMIAPSAIPAEVYAIHNGVGHADQASLGECYRYTFGDKESCQENKDDWKEIRAQNQGPPNGGAADGDAANDVAGPANPNPSP